ncbi:MAG TPA: flagellar hook capping FlgD N-terminal domain-containing protein [Smithellaceae bacterium]|nr:flagellar hook capping FlgD N-terminal domain-containing protein [Smithellaceae bacterium]
MDTAIQSVANSAVSTTINKTKDIMGKDDFMKMLLAQLKNQDPLNPMDGKDFAVQLAQFTQLEKLTNLNATMESLPGYLKSFNNAQMVGMIGNDAVARGNVINVTGAATNVVFNLPSDIQSGTVKIYNENGSLVDSVDIGSKNAGINTVTWMSEGFHQGNYTFEVSAVDKSGNAVAADTLISGKVTGASFKNDEAYLTINGQEVAFSTVTAINKSNN